MNIASRIEGLAEPGATYITEETFKLTEGFFRVEALRERKIRGKSPDDFHISSRICAYMGWQIIP